MSKRSRGTDRGATGPTTWSVTSAVAKNTLGGVIGRVLRGERVFITRYGRPQVVMLSVEEYERLVGEVPVDLEELELRFDTLLDRMQSPEQRSAVSALFSMSGEELGAAVDRSAEGASHATVQADT